jgi:hypothetical protein
VTSEIGRKIEEKKTAIEKLYSITEFYRKYYMYTLDFGGCPILNIGIDANHQNPVLIQKVQKAIKNIQGSIATIIHNGLKNQEIKFGIDAEFYARQIFARIEGAVFMTMTTKNEIYLKDMVAGINHMIESDLKQ